MKLRNLIKRDSKMNEQQLVDLYENKQSVEKIGKSKYGSLDKEGKKKSYNLRKKRKQSHYNKFDA